jgi:hypothetical protein
MHVGSYDRVTRPAVTRPSNGRIVCANSDRKKICLAMAVYVDFFPL